MGKRKDATEVTLEQVRKAYKAYLDAGEEGPWRMTPENSFTGQTNLICWEDGPYEWAYNFTDRDHAALKGIFLEPYNSFTLAVVDER